MKHSQLLLLVALVPIPAFSTGFGYRMDVSHDRELIRKVAVIDEEGRRTEEEYARVKGLSVKGVRTRFASTGELTCGSVSLSAQLTGSAGVITTAGHSFYSSANCQKRIEPTSCTFVVRRGKEKRQSKVTSMVANGIKSKCPSPPEAYDDWAVLEISPPLNGIKLYSLPESSEARAGDKVISVAASNLDFVRTDPRTGQKIYPKTIDECEIKAVDRTAEPVLLESNCDTGKGASGGSVLRVEFGADVLIGIHSANDEVKSMVEEADRTGRPNVGPYKPDQWAAYHVPLAGNFLRAVRQAVR